MGLLGAVLVAILVIAALTAPFISPYDPIEQHPGFELQPPSAQFRLGTDNLGRDLLSRIIWGSRSSLFIGMVAVGIGAGFGIASGLAAGYLGGWIDAVAHAHLRRAAVVPRHPAGHRRGLGARRRAAERGLGAGDRDDAGVRAADARAGLDRA